MEVPEGSLYTWCYRQGLHGVELNDIYQAVYSQGRELRDKDVLNYWRGFSNHKDPFRVAETTPMQEQLIDFPQRWNVGMYEKQNRWIPCTADGRPLIKWGQGCFDYHTALAFRGCKTLGENLKDSPYIVIDCDCDHSDEYDLRLAQYMWPLAQHTHSLYKTETIMGYPASFHLMYKTDLSIPTAHYNKCHIDILGNAKNQVRYLKTKQWNHLPPAELTQEVWDYIREYVRRYGC